MKESSAMFSELAHPPILDVTDLQPHFGEEAAIKGDIMEVKCVRTSNMIYRIYSIKHHSVY